MGAVVGHEHTTVFSLTHAFRMQRKEKAAGRAATEWSFVLLVTSPLQDSPLSKMACPQRYGAQHTLPNTIALVTISTATDKCLSLRKVPQRTHPHPTDVVLKLLFLNH